MKKKTVNVSIKPGKFLVVVLAMAFILVLVFFFRSNSGNRSNNEEEKKEIVKPLDFGVADSGFEGLISTWTTLNAQATLDKYAKIDGVASLKITFSDQAASSVKISDYFNAVFEDDFYRLGFWAKNEANSERKINVRITKENNAQDLGEIILRNNGEAEYFEFVFHAENDAENLILSSSDAENGNVWIDNAKVEKLNVGSVEELNGLRPTVFGNTAWQNVDQSQEAETGDSGDFLAKPTRKIGQVFQPARELFSGAAVKILRHGTGGTNLYQLQIREFDEQSGAVSEKLLASAYVNIALKPELAEEIQKEEQNMREEFARREKDIVEGKIEDEETADRYPDTFTQAQIDADKKTKRTAKLEIAVRDMKESFNTIEEIAVPLAARLDPNKKYWLGLDNSGATVSNDNYISVITAGSGSEESDEDEETGEGDEEAADKTAGGFSSEIPGNWQNSANLWFKIFYPVHAEREGKKILSGATVADLGAGKAVYRYQFKKEDYNSFSGFSGRRVYDLDSGSYENINLSGHYIFADEQQSAVYKFETFSLAEKIILRDIHYHQSLAIDFSVDGNDWEEIFADNPAEENQLAVAFAFRPQTASDEFYLRLRSDGNKSVPVAFSLEAELVEN